MEVNSGEGRWCGVDKVVVVVRAFTKCKVGSRFGSKT
jgi:hypothetical protein